MSLEYIQQKMEGLCKMQTEWQIPYLAVRYLKISSLFFLHEKFVCPFSYLVMHFMKF